MRFDLSNRSLKKIDSDILKNNLEFLTTQDSEEQLEIDEKKVESALFDNNQLSKLDSLDKFSNIKHLSLTNNRLVDIKAIAKLKHLEFVNLLNNSLTSLNAFKDLKNLKWINISGNQIRSLEPLGGNKMLEHIDANNNEISVIGNLTSLTKLISLNLNQNELEELSSIPKSLSKSVVCLFISNNCIEDLNEFCYLQHLECLENLCVNSNPCTSYISAETMFDYRPFILNWCLDLIKLDGIQVNQKEFLKAEWLYSQGKGRHFRPGQNPQLIEYLVKTCPFTGYRSSEEEVRLSKVLEKKELYQNSTEHFVERNFLPIDSFDNKPCANTLVKQGTYDKRVEPLDFVDLLQNNNNNSHSEITQTSESGSDTTSNKPNLIDNINLSSSASENIGQHDEQDIEEMTLDKDLNRSKYSDYDSRPIKPLDPNKLKNQLSEYTELTEEEMLQLKQRSQARRIRAKTVDAHAPKPNGHSSHRIPIGTSSNKSPVARQLSFNSNRSMASIVKKQATTATTPISSRLVDMKRSKTEEVLNRQHTGIKYSTPTKPKYNPQHYSPHRQSIASSPYLRQMSNTKIDTSKPSIKTSLPISSRKTTAKTTTTLGATKTVSSNKPSTKVVAAPTSTVSNGINKATINKTQAEATTPASGLSPAAVNKQHLKHSEIHSKIQKQRQEMLLNKQRNFNEFRNQLKLEQERSQSMHHLEQHQEEEQKNVNSEPVRKVGDQPKATKVVYTFADRCAIKIQSMWRGYQLRKRISEQNIQKKENYQYLMEYVGALRKSLKELMIDHQRLMHIHQDDCVKIKKTIETFALKTNESKDTKVDNNKISSVAHQELQDENRVLKEKIRFLEDKYADLELRFRAMGASPKGNTSNTTLGTKLIEKTMDDTVDNTTATTTAAIEPKIEIHPPVRVRLQKLNEKRVALKWNHSPMNQLCEIHGYNIYINGKLCGKMSPNDLLASINGIQEEGEYRIFMRAFYGSHESANSNEVITRVKRKANTQSPQSTMTTASTDTAHSVTGSQETNTSGSNNSNQSVDNTNQNDNGHEAKANTTNESTSTTASSTDSHSSGSHLDEKKDFLALMKERLTGMVSQSINNDDDDDVLVGAQQPTNQQHQSVANRLAKNPTPSYSFLTKDEKEHVLNRSGGSDNSNSNNQHPQNGPPFSQIQSNKMQTNRHHHNQMFSSSARSEPSTEHNSFTGKVSLDSSLPGSKSSNQGQRKQNRSIDFHENDENTDSLSNLFGYLSNIQPVRESRRRKSSGATSAV